MTIAYLCVLINSLLPIIWAGYAKRSLGFKFKNNENPREFLAAGTGKSQRANWAQQNAWEAFAPFAAAVLIAVQAGVEPALVDQCAIVFTIARIGYGVCYIANKHVVRSTLWTVGMVSTLVLYYLVWSH